MMRSSICALTVLACAGSAAAFAPTAALPLKATSRSALLSRGIRRSSQAPLSGLKAQLSPQDVQALSDGAMHLAGILPQGFVDGSTSYFNLFVPMIKAVGLPPFLQTWFHGDSPCCASVPAPLLLFDAHEFPAVSLLFLDLVLSCIFMERSDGMLNFCGGKSPASYALQLHSFSDCSDQTDSKCIVRF